MAIPHLQDSSLRLTDCIFFGDSIAEAAFSGIILDGSVTLAKLAPDVTAVAIGGAAASHTHAASAITSGTLPMARGGTGATSLGPATVVYSTGSVLASSEHFMRSSFYDGQPCVSINQHWAYGGPQPRGVLHVVAAGAAGSHQGAAWFSTYWPADASERRVASYLSVGSDTYDFQQVQLRASWLQAAGQDGPKLYADVDFTVSVPTGNTQRTDVLNLKWDGTTNALHGLNVYDGQLTVESIIGLAALGKCAVQVTSEVNAGQGERAAIFLEGKGWDGYSAVKMSSEFIGHVSSPAEFINAVNYNVQGWEVYDSNAGETRLSIAATTGDIQLLGNTFVGGPPAAPPRSRLEVTQKKTSIAAGEGAAFRVNSGAEPDYGTPGANTNIAGQFFSNNASITNASLWGLNVVVGQGAAPIPAPTPPAGGIHIVGAEIEVFNRSDAGNAELRPVDPYASPNQIRSNGIEIIGHSGSTYRNAGALVVWANDATGGKWWDTGLSLSRCYSYGVRFHRIAGDSVEPFQGALLDASELATAIQPLILARSSGDVRYDITNDADYSIYLNLDTGSTAADESALLFSDRGARKWFVGKDSSNRLQIGWNDGATAFAAVSAYIDDEVTPTGALLSFYGAAPAAKPTVTGSKGGNAALASLLTALATLGLITDSTT